MPDLTDPSEAPLKQWGIPSDVGPKSFSSRFVTHVKPDSVKVVRRKKSGLVDDHFEAVILSESEDENGEDQPPCNCPRHGVPKQDFKSQVGLRHNRLKSTHQAKGLLHESSLGKPLTIIVNSKPRLIFLLFSSFF